ncbi:hypothetical protein B0J18DRAFT_158458 [Chaetomium sp. MPI-SDFR-AT-0129]|nr:hypothetical protein B0J18DRAFT_158458 [Chaetomium sp. MPI-SDFR-AT-0129]
MPCNAGRLVSVHTLALCGMQGSCGWLVPFQPDCLTACLQPLGEIAAGYLDELLLGILGPAAFSQGVGFIGPGDTGSLMEDSDAIRGRGLDWMGLVSAAHCVLRGSEHVGRFLK